MKYYKHDQVWTDDTMKYYKHDQVLDVRFTFTEAIALRNWLDRLKPDENGTVAGGLLRILKQFPSMEPAPTPAQQFCTCGVNESAKPTVPDPKLAWRHTSTCPHSKT